MKKVYYFHVFGLHVHPLNPFVKISGYGAAAGASNGQGAKPNGKPINNIKAYHVHLKKMTGLLLK